MKRSMFIGLLLALCAGVHGFVPGHVAASQCCAGRHMPVAMGLGDRIGAFFKKVKAGASERKEAAVVEAELTEAEKMDEAMKAVTGKTNKATGAPIYPTAKEIQDYCRDPESSGCDIDMVCSPARPSTCARARSRSAGCLPACRWRPCWRRLRRCARSRRRS